MPITKKDLIEFKDHLAVEQAELKELKVKANEEVESKVKKYKETLLDEMSRALDVREAELNGKLMAINSLIEKAPDDDTLDGQENLL